MTNALIVGTEQNTLLADYGDKDLVSDAYTRMQQFAKNQSDKAPADALALTEFKSGPPRPGDRQKRSGCYSAAGNCTGSARSTGRSELNAEATFGYRRQSVEAIYMARHSPYGAASEAAY
jgi:hypothetical protein